MKYRNKTINIVMIGVFAAVLAVLSQIAVPLPSGIPVTLQTFAVALCGYVLGWKRGVMALAVYIALGAVGLPVFTGFYAGAGVLVGVTGGYIWGFLPLAALCGAGLKTNHRILAVALGLAGLAACHLLGSLQFALVSGSSPLNAFLIASAPYLIKDVISVAAAYGVSRALAFGLKKGGVELGV